MPRPVITFNAAIWNIEHTKRTIHTDVELCSAGVILDYGTDTEILIPFGSGRVLEVLSSHPGTIRIEVDR